MTTPLGVEQMSWDLPETLRDFLPDRHPVRGVMGPVGSAKTTTVMAMDILYKACRQAPSPTDGVRYSRELIIRATEPRLVSTTINTFLEWMKPELFGAHMKYDTPITYSARFAIAANDIVDLKVYFMAAGPAQDAEKLKSLEVGRIRINEATEVSWEVFDMARRRIDRFPKEQHGHCDEPGVSMDFNPPNPEHWIYKLMEGPAIEGFRWWKQPPAVLEDPNGPLVSLEGTRYKVNKDGDPTLGILPADNINHLSETYYANQVNGAEDSKIKVLLMNHFGFIEDGVPIHKNFKEPWHYPGIELPVYEGLSIMTGWDFGGTPAVAFAQLSPKGQLRILAELCADTYIGFPTFLDQIVLPFVAVNFPWMLRDGRNSGFGDPAGREGEESVEDTNFDDLRKRGFAVLPSPDFKNTYSRRQKALDHFINTNVDGNQPSFIVSNKCPTLRAGLAGRYKMAKVLHGANHGNLKTQPVKNIESHICEAVQYLALGIRGIEDDTTKIAAAYVHTYNQGIATGGHPSGY
jgi:hypothetical protein